MRRVIVAVVLLVAPAITRADGLSDADKVSLTRGEADVTEMRRLMDEGLAVLAAREQPLYEPQVEWLHNGNETTFDLYFGRGPDRMKVTFCMHPNPHIEIPKWIVHIPVAVDAPEPLPEPPKVPE